MDTYYGSTQKSGVSVTIGDTRNCSTKEALRQQIVTYVKGATSILTGAASSHRDPLGPNAERQNSTPIPTVIVANSGEQLPWRCPDNCCAGIVCDSQLCPLVAQFVVQIREWNH